MLGDHKRPGCAGDQVGVVGRVGDGAGPPGVLMAELIGQVLDLIGGIPIDILYGINGGAGRNVPHPPGLVPAPGQCRPDW